MNENELFTVAEIAEYLKISKMTVYKMIKAKKLPALKIGEKCVRITKEKLNEYISSQNRL